MANAVADQCVYVAHGVDCSAKMSTMVNKRISWAAKPQQFGQEQNRSERPTHGVFLFASLRAQTGALGGEFLSGIEKERKKTYIRGVSELEFKWSPLESEHVKLVTRKVSKRVLTHWQLLAA